MIKRDKEQDIVRRTEGKDDRREYKNDKKERICVGTENGRNQGTKRIPKRHGYAIKKKKKQYERVTGEIKGCKKERKKKVGRRKRKGKRRDEKPEERQGRIWHEI